MALVVTPAPLPPTTVPAVRAELFARLTAALAAIPQPAPVFYGHPGLQMPRELVAVLAMKTPVEHEPRTLTARTRGSTEETYDLLVTVSVLLGDQDQTATQIAAERAWQLAGAVDDVCRTWQTSLAGRSVRTVWATAFDETFLHLQEGRAVDIDITVHVTNRV